jgi:hypothetical protein
MDMVNGNQISKQVIYTKEIIKKIKNQGKENIHGLKDAVLRDNL